MKQGCWLYRFLVVMLLGFFTSSALAQQVTRPRSSVVTESMVPPPLSGRYPARGKPSRANALHLSVDALPAGSYGYQPLTLTVDASPAVAANRTVTVELQVRAQYYGPVVYDKTVVEHDIELAAGTTTASTEILVPRLHPWAYLDVHAWVDGVADPELSGQIPVSFRGARRGSYDESTFRPTLYELHPSLSTDSGDDALAEKAINYKPHELIRMQRIQGPMPNDWRALSRFDAVLATPERLADMTAQDRQQLVQWVKLGGVLVVQEVGEEYAKLDNVETLLQLNPSLINLPLARTLRDQASTQEDERPPSQPELPQALPIADRPAWDWAEVRYVNNQFNQEFNWKEEFLPVDAGSLVAGRAWFIQRACGLGLVVAFQQELGDSPSNLYAPLALAGNPISFDEQPSDLRPYFADALRRYLANHRIENRLGTPPDVGAELFSNWLVPGVGAAPVDAFRWLITFFVLLVGPVSYFLLRAIGRTNLLLFTAPGAALVFTTILFVYATLGDGFGVRARVRGVCLLDQQAGQAVSWSRQTYYAGLAPADGMVFPNTSMVYPILAGWSQDEGTPSLHLLLEPEEMRLTDGWLSSRETRQVSVQNAGPCQAKLMLQQEGEGLNASNQLGVPIEMLVALDSQDQWWIARKIAHTQQAVMQQEERNQVVNEVRALLTAANPEFPPGLDPYEVNRGIFGSRRRQWQPQLDVPFLASGVETPSLNRSRLEQMFQKLSGVETGLPLPIDRGTFMAVSRQAVGVPLGFKDLQEEGSLHLTLGRWAP